MKIPRISPRRASVLLFALLGLGVELTASAATNTPSGLDYSSFKAITDKNIFNSRRRPGRTYQTTTPRSRVDSVALTGVITYEKGPFAFFDSQRSEFQKVAKVSDTIAGFKITEIQPSFVKLASETNELVMLVGKELRRSDGGPWQIADRTVFASDSGGRDFGRDSRDSRGSRDSRFQVPRSGDSRGTDSVVLGSVPQSPDGQPQVFVLDPNNPPDGGPDDSSNGPETAPALTLPPAASGEAAAVLQRLMERRARENQ